MQDQPRWLAHAWAELGQREAEGRANNQRIVALFRDIGQDAQARDEVAWCAAFVGACLERGGEPSTRSLRARSYLDWGQSLAEPRLGAIAVLPRGGDPALGHVGFLVGATEEAVMLLGGNQGDAVSVEAFDRARVLGFRWPMPRAGETGDVAAGGVVVAREASLFERALTHVLEMEGGFSNDRYDPGGPTNKGITLSVYAAAKGVALDEIDRAALVAELKRIPDVLVRRIYLERYWHPSQASELAPALALMHFDTAVNHGVGSAIRMLQEAVGTAADGEIGPDTRRAIGRLPEGATIERYAAIRRRRYRALPHFWRFGRGWLNRVNKTEAKARAWLSAAPIPNNDHEQKGDTEITDTNNETPVAAPKWWGESMTIWGTLVTALSTVLPVIGPLIGINLTGELIQQIGEHVVEIVQAVGGLLGILMTIYGRARRPATGSKDGEPQAVSGSAHSWAVQAPGGRFAGEPRTARPFVPTREGFMRCALLKLATASIAALLLFLPASADADCISDWSVAALLVKSEGLATIETLVERARTRISGEILKASLCAGKDGWSYQIVVRGVNGGLRLHTVNARDPFAR